MKIKIYPIGSKQNLMMQARWLKILLGPPGVGKTHIVKKAAKKAGKKIKKLKVKKCSMEDVSGIPINDV